MVLALARLAGWRPLYGLDSLFWRRLRGGSVTLLSQHSVSSAKIAHGGINCQIPPTAPPTVRSHPVFMGSG